MDGMYNTRSATTNPTGKNKLEAGTKGRMSQEKACHENFQEKSSTTSSGRLPTAR
jgi:hypothetical protein